MNYLLRSLSPSTIAVLCLLFVGSPALVGCDDDDDEAAEEAEENGEEADGEAEDGDSASATPPDEFTASIPADAEAVVTISSIRNLIELPEIAAQSDNVSSDTQAQWQELLEDFRDEMEANVGYDLTDAATYEGWGIDPDGKFLAGITDTAVFCLPIADQSDFETFAVDVAAGEFGEVEDPQLETDELNGHDLYRVDEMAWLYHGDSACVSGELDGIDPEDTLAAFLEGPGEGNSLADSEGFQQFLDAGMGDGLFSIYAGGDALMDELMGPMGPPGMGMMLGDLLAGQGTNLSVDDDTLKLRMWTGLDEDRTQMVQNITTPDHNFDWSGFATQDTTAALRLSLNPEAIWEQVEAFLAQEFEDIDEFFEMAMEDDASAEDYLINNLSGHIGLFVYDLPDPMALMMNDPEDLGEDMGVLAAVHFADSEPLAEALEALEALLEADPEGGMEYSDLDDDIRVLDIDDVEARFYHYDDVVAVSSTGLAEDEVASILRGESADDSLAANGAVLGAALAEDAFNGLYLGGDIWSYVGDFLELPDAEEHFDEFVIRIDANDQGVSLGADFYPAGSAIYGVALTAIAAEAQAPAPGMVDEPTIEAVETVQP